MMPVASPAEPLRRLVGDAVLTGAAAVRFSVAGEAPSAVVAPSDAEQVAAVLALAAENGWTVEPAGAGTWLAAGRRPERADLVLSTDRLRSIREYEPADLTIGVDAGVSLDALQERVAQHRQMLPLDPPGSGAGTLGATFATASAGPLRLGLGTPRDHALGVDVVTGDGRLLRLGGRVVKNVAGYDLVRLMVGSRGTLGIITGLHVRLRPLPERDITLALCCGGAREACALTAQLRALTQPAALEVISPVVARGLIGEESWALLLRLQGNADTVREAHDRVAGAHSAVRVLDETRAERSTAPAGAYEVAATEPGAALSAWRTLRDSEGRAGVYLRLADLPAHLPDTLERALAIASSGASAHRVNEWHCAAHAGDGIVRLWRAAPPADGAATANAIETVRRELTTGGGTLHVPVGAHRLSSELEPFGDAGPTLRIMRELKRAFDPQGLLAPGRFLP